MGHDHHHHHHHHTHQNSLSNIGLAFLVNFVFAIIEFVGGIWTGSIAIQSDAVHDFGDSLTLGFAYFMERFSLKKSDHIHSYGYRRLSLLSGVATGLILLVGAGYIIIRAIGKFSDPTTPNTSGMIGLAIVGIAGNGFVAWRLSRGAGHNEKILSWHLWEDVMGWVAVLIAAIVMRFVHFPIIDPILSILISLVTIVGAFRALGPCVRILLQATPKGVDTAVIVQKITGLESVSGVHDFHFWSLDGLNHVATMHVVVEASLSVQATEQLKLKIRQIVSAEHKVHSTIEFESKDENQQCAFHECV